MRVKDLPPWLQEIVKQRTKEDNGHFNVNSCISALFVFGYTPEGHDYWKDIHEGKIPPNPNKQMAQQIQVRDAERRVHVKHFKYNKATKIFTIKQKDLLPLVRPMDMNTIPKRIILTGITGKSEGFNIDIFYSECESITIPKSLGKAYTIEYYGLEYTIDVIVDVHDLEQPVLHGKTQC